jgi:hypothetical protein
MYTALLIILLFLAGWITTRGFKKENTSITVMGIILGILVLLFFWFMGFWGEKLWFDQMGYNDRFWTEWISKIGLFFVAFILGGIIVFLLSYKVSGQFKYFRQFAILAGAVFSGLWWFARWELVLRFLNRVPTDLQEPILNQDTSFYLFTYPLIQSLYNHILILIIIALGTSMLGFVNFRDKDNVEFNFTDKVSGHKSVFLTSSFLLIILGVGRFIARYDLLYSDYGIVSGPGWTDANIRLPLLFVVSLISVAAGIILLIPAFRLRIKRISLVKTDSPFLSILSAGTWVFLTWIVLLGVVPMLFQWLKVEPNEITVEKEYIENNIKFTRSGFHLDKVEEKEFNVSDNFTQETVEENQNLFNNIRLWDYRALDAVFKQFQEIRLYYEFHDVDIDRYTIGDQYREVMISAREMQPGNLPTRSQTFVNKRFKYTHGYGAVLNLVNEFTPQGLPNLLIKDIPPVSEYPDLQITRPEVYFGELTDEYVIANSAEKEFDYPSGEKNIYTHYNGEGGVQISNFWRKFLYGWKYGGTRFLLSGYTNEESRIMIHRQVVERASKLAPFLYFDDDPYVVISNGKLYWIIDAYTYSSFYPYSEPFSSFTELTGLSRENTDYRSGLVRPDLQGKNYIRNSVKLVIDAFNGQTNLYIFEEKDPLIQVYNKIFPGLLKPKSEMPRQLREHIRYPADMLLVQGLVYAKYHMTDPTVFYNQEDLWVRATEKYYNQVQPVEPYYIMWEPPGSDEMEFILMLPFTPKNKQVMIGWIAGMCDNENYGRFLAYKFPKEKRILGTQQVETKIDQDSYLSGQLTLWDQRGSNVIRGNVLAIPIDNTIIYVEPIYLKSETSAYPELRMVAIMHNDNLSYAETFDEALKNLIGEDDTQEETIEDIDETLEELIQKANSSFENYLQNMQEKRFNQAGNELENLQEALRKLSEERDVNVKDR